MYEIARFDHLVVHFSHLRVPFPLKKLLRFALIPKVFDSCYRGGKPAPLTTGIKDYNIKRPRIACNICIQKCYQALELTKVTYEDGLFVHTTLHNFFTQEGAEKQYCLEQGLEWTGGDSIDDYC